MIATIALFLLQQTITEPAQQSPPPAPALAPAAPAPSPSEEFSKAFFFGRRFFELKDYVSAVEQFEKADRLQPDVPEVLYDKAVVLARAGRYSDAQISVDRYNRLYPDGREKALVVKLQLELDFQRELQKKRQADAGYAEIVGRGKYLAEKNDLEGALKQYLQAEEIRPNDPAPIFNEGVIFEAKGDLVKAAERFRRYQQLESEPDAKNLIDQRLFALTTEIEDTKTKILCPFCGFLLPIGELWCPHCWHGPYLVSDAAWSSRPCIEGASAVRQTYYSDGRFAKNEPLPCLFPKTMAEALRYTPARRRAIVGARKAEGWIYDGDIMQGRTDKDGNQIRFVHEGGRLTRALDLASGQVLEYAAHKAGDDHWLLDREDLIIDGQRFTSHYSYDPSGHILQQTVEFQSNSSCGHLISESADFAYLNGSLASARIHGGYDGFAVEGLPRTDWAAGVTFGYDTFGRLAREELTVSAFNKVYSQQPAGKTRDEINHLYPSMRPRRPVENILRTGDLCASAGTLMLGNPIDLRPFYAFLPNLDTQLPFGVAKATVAMTYPDSYSLR